MRSFIVFILAYSLCGCIHKEELVSDKEVILKHLYNTTKEYYANFENRPNFEAAYGIARNQLDNQTSEKEFFNICTQLLASLEDPHIRLVSPDSTFYTFNYLNYGRTVDLNRIQAHYLKEGYTENKRVLYGVLDENIGYLYLPDFTDWTSYDELPSEAKSTMHALKETDGLVIDLRNNDGGSAIYAQALAAYFTQQRFLWHQSINKTGPEPNDFDQPYSWYLNPPSDYFYNQPVVVLTSRYTVSAGERFVLAMKELQNARVIGQRTAGTQGSVMGFEMLNGWWFTLTFEKILDASGKNWDYVGIPPDLEVNTTVSQFPENKDPILELAMQEIKR